VFIFPTTKNPKSTLQSRLFLIAALVLFLMAATLTLSPTVKYRSWNADLRWAHWAAYFIWLAGASLIHRITIKIFNDWDAIILPTAFLLVGWGMLTIWRLSFVFGIRQTLWYILAIILGIFVLRSENFLDTLKKYKYVILILGLILAVLTFFFGTYPGGEGPKLWLGFHGIYFQPSEPLKLILIVYLAAFFSEKYYLKFDILQTILPTLILVATALFILVGQRDMGTALIFIVIYIGMLYIIFGKKRILGIGAFIVGLAAVTGYLFIDLIRIRFQAWVEPWLDPQSGSYQIIQSIIAIAAGGLFGSGFGIGYPGLVPVPHSDFIYASIVEETGLVGAIALISLFTILLFRGMQTAIRTNSKFYRFLASGISIFIAFQTVLIIGGNIRLLPITGVTLPFISYGGSSLLTSTLSLFLLTKISSTPKTEQVRTASQDPISLRNITLLLSAAMVLLTVVTGWWAIIHSSDLQLRQDNPRNLIASRFVKRGSFLDRNDYKLTTNTGQIGHYRHEILYPDLSNTIGYYDYTYGISGLEAEYDNYLSGQAGYPSFDTWFNYLLYDQPLPGLDVKLTLDLDKQKILDTMLKGHQGAAVVMNASTGEILALASFPSFNTNSLEENWQAWNSDDTSPFLNRVTQGAYPLGELLSAFLIADNNSVLKDDFSTAASTNGSDLCAVGESSPKLWSQAISQGCRSALKEILKDKSSDVVIQALSRYGLNTPIDIGLPLNKTQELGQVENWQELLYGVNRIRVSPLQVAYAFSVFSNTGLQPTPALLSAYKTAKDGWVASETSQGAQVISTEIAQDISRLLASEEISGWEISANAQDENGTYSWYVAGTPSLGSSNPLVVVVVTEESNADDLRWIGRQIFKLVTDS
jgi:cell division protein FtsW (lipid II flippase)